MANKEDIKLNDRQKLFCDYYLISFNGAQAAIKAGYSKKTAKQIAAENLTKPDIQKYLNKAKTKVFDAVEITRDRVLKELGRLAFSDVRQVYGDNNTLKEIKDLSDDAAAFVAGVKVDEIIKGKGDQRTVVGNTVEVKLRNKDKALEILARHFKIIDSDDVGNTFNISINGKKMNARG